MTQAQAEALVAGQKIKYWDNRIATVTQAAIVEPPLPPGTITTNPPSAGVKIVTIIFDAVPDPKPHHIIKANDFMRADPV